MRVSISKSEVKGSVIAPASKSYTIRGLMCAALARGQSEIINPLTSDDTEASLDVLTRLGNKVIKAEGSWRVSGGALHEPKTELFCRESAATLRFMTAISSLVPGTCRLTSAPSLAIRPVEPLLEALRKLGVDCHYQQREGCVVINGGALRGGTTELPGNISSQFVSALLFISPLADKGIKIKLTTPLESKPYVLMTIECMRAFGMEVIFSDDLREFETSRQVYQPTRYRVEGDWSSASYLLALGALGGDVEVEDLNPQSIQADRMIIDLLQDMGAQVTIGDNKIRVAKSGLKAIKADLTDCIDLLPTIAVLAAVAAGTSEFTGIDRARLKESNRVRAVREGLEAMGVSVTEEQDRLTVTGTVLKGAVIDTKGDHRIAMAFSLPGIIVGETVINGAECVAKTYPEYWDILRNIGGEVKIDGK